MWLGEVKDLATNVTLKRIQAKTLLILLGLPNPSRPVPFHAGISPESVGIGGAWQCLSSLVQFLARKEGVGGCKQKMYLPLGGRALPN